MSKPIFRVWCKKCGHEVQGESGCMPSKKDLASIWNRGNQINPIENLTETEAKQMLNDISDIFKIGSAARTPSAILTNAKNAANDEFCRHKRVVEYLEGTTFRFIKKATGYLFTRPGYKPDASGKTIMEAVERAMTYEEEMEEMND